MKEAFLIMNYSKGGMNYDNIINLPFDIYELSVNEANRIQELYNENK